MVLVLIRWNFGLESLPSNPEGQEEKIPCMRTSVDIRPGQLEAPKWPAMHLATVDEYLLRGRGERMRCFNNEGRL